MAVAEAEHLVEGALLGEAAVVLAGAGLFGEELFEGAGELLGAEAVAAEAVGLVLDLGFDFGATVVGGAGVDLEEAAASRRALPYWRASESRPRQAR